MTTTDDIRTYTVNEIADLLGISTRTVQRMVADGRLTAIDLGVRTTRISHAALNAFLNTHTPNRKDNQ